MPVPPYSLNGILPPFLGADPSESSHLMSPYPASVAEVVQRFATTDPRKEILANWVRFRQDLRAIGITRGYSWLGGSFMEDKELRLGLPPKDLDLLIFYRRPSKHRSQSAWSAFFQTNVGLFDHDKVKATYKMDTWFVDLDGNTDDLVLLTRYIMQLFCHQRDTFLWKGMLNVSHTDIQDDPALLRVLVPAAPGVGP